MVTRITSLHHFLMYAKTNQYVVHLKLRHIICQLYFSLKKKKGVSFPPQAPRNGHIRARGKVAAYWPGKICCFLDLALRSLPNCEKIHFCYVSPQSMVFFYGSLNKLIHISPIFLFLSNTFQLLWWEGSMITKVVPEPGRENSWKLWVSNVGKLWQSSPS